MTQHTSAILHVYIASRQPQQRRYC